MVAFDCTYLTKSLCQLKLGNNFAMVGGVYGGDDRDQSFLPINEELEVQKVIKASSMLEVVAWDAAGLRKLPLSACSCPIETNHSGPGATSRGAWFVVNILSKILGPSGSTVRAVVFDAHGSHSIVRKIFHGEEVPREELDGLAFWDEISYKPLPPCSLPRLPTKVCLHRGEPIYGIPGVRPWLAFLQCHFVGSILAL